MSSNGTGQSNFIADVLRLAEEANAQAEVQRKALVDEVIRGLEKVARPHLEKLKESGANIAEGEASLQNEGKSVSHLQYRLSLAGFLPFWLVVQPWGNEGVQIFYQNQPMTGNDHSPYQREMVQVKDEVGFGRFLLKRRALWEKAEAERQAKQTKQRKEEAEKLCQKLENYYWPDFIADPEEAEQAIAQVGELYPAADIAGLRQKWSEARKNYLVKQANEAGALAAQQQKEALYRQKLDEFKAAYDAYRVELERVQAINRDRFPALQERWNTPFAYYELHYALYVRGNEEDEGDYIETARVDCLASMKGDFHAEIKRNGSVQRYEYMRSHVFKVSEEKRGLPLDYPNAGKIAILAETGTIQHLRYPPGTDPIQVEADVRATFEPLPKEPDEGGLSCDDVRRIKRGDGDEPDF